MSVIFTADLHLNHKPLDEYRWEIFRWLRSQTADELIIGGDLTDAKDHHPSILVNRLYKELTDLSLHYKRVIILKGNHDYFDPKHPFFEFVGSDTGKINYIKEPRVIDLSIGRATLIPAGEKWGGFKLHEFPFVFTHATFSGAKAENGTILTGVDPAVLDDYNGIVYSGDIHVPQELRGGKIIYVGAPYHTRFGDSFKPRVLEITNRDDSDLYFPAPRKVILTITKPEHLFAEDVDQDASKGDHVKVRVLLHRAEYVKWKEYKEIVRNIAEDKGWLLFSIESVPLEIEHKDKPETDTDTGLTSEEILLDYAKRNKASKLHIQLGKELLAG
jgi:UDP-2,3-diacylglucosamine pyrophosphatase LpxH